jgi:hypothetical protein
MPYLELTTTMPLELETLYEGMVAELTALEVEETPSVIRCRKAIPLIQRNMERLKQFAYKSEFRDQEEEIHFFKHIKPRFHSQLVYFLQLYHLETGLPHGSRDAQLAYLSSRLNKQQGYLMDKASFYSYFNSGASYFDHLYFMRGKIELDINLTDFYINADPAFTTSHDYTLSQLLAAEILSYYLESRIDEIKGDKPKDEKALISTLTWTSHKNFLIELIYALYSFGAFNHGKADIKTIADNIERTFNVKLGNLYRTFQEIRIRKKGQTFFLDQLVKSLQELITEQEEHPRYD